MRCNCYLVTNGRFNVIVDTSVKSERNLLHKKIQKIPACDWIFLTHAHFDHVGNAAFLQKQFSSKILISSDEKSFLTKGFSPISDGTNVLTKSLTSLVKNRKIFRFEKVTENIFTANELSYFDEIKTSVLKTPGHTCGSISFIIDDEIAIIGDTMVNFAGNIFPPFADSCSELKKSWQILLDTGCKLFLPAHGKIVSRSVLQYKSTKWLVISG
jgi:glyoxylase-like metal-dependent hydrolase (beta-lactamase superfamily II)